MGWRKWNRIIHRDAGYFFFGLFIIYAVSGIALNHKDDWNPNYIITNQSFESNIRIDRESLSDKVVNDLLLSLDLEPEFKKYYFPKPNIFKVFIENGAVTLNLDSGEGTVEKIKKRPVFKEMNFLHYNNPKKFWTFYSDFFAAFMIIIAISGLIIVRGKNGFKKRGIWFVILGMIAPLLILILFG